MLKSRKTTLRKKISLITLSMLLMGDFAPSVLSGTMFYKTVYAQEDATPVEKTVLEDSDLTLENIENVLTITGLSEEGKQKVLVNHRILIQPTQATAIAGHAFQELNLTEVEISDKVTHIEEYAFANNKLIEFKDGGKLQYLGAYALYGNQLNKVELSAVSIQEFALASNKLETVILTQATSVGSGVFTENNDLNKVIVNTENPPQTLFKKDTFEQGNQVTHVLIEKNDHNVESDKDDIYLVNPVTLVVKFKDNSNGSFISEELLKYYEKGNLPDDWIAEDYEGYTLESERTLPINKDSIVNNEVIIEFLYRRKNKPIIIVPTEKQFVYRPTDSLDTREIIKNIVFYDELGNKIDPFANNKLDPRITVTPERINSPGKDSSTTVVVKLTTDGGEDAAELNFEFRKINLWKEEVSPGSGWVYEDFKYNSHDSISGLSDLGIEKLKKNKNLVLPGIHPESGKPILKIDNYSFENKTLDTVDFAELKSLEVIGYRAFRNSQVASALNIEVATNLKQIYGEAFNNDMKGGLSAFPFETFSKLEFIDNSAFKNNSLTNVTITDAPKFRRIGSSAFEGNKINELNLSGLPNFEEIDHYSFKDNELTTLTLSDLPKLREIKYESFRKNFLKDVTLQNLPMLQEIFGHAFNENAIENLNVSNLSSLRKISNFAFQNNKIKSVDFSQMPNLEELDGFEGNQLTEVDIKGLQKLRIIHHYAFKNNKITEVAIEDLPSLDEIKYESFALNPLKKVTFSGLPKFKRFYDRTFSDTKLEELVLNDLPSLIEINGFQNNRTLKKVTIENLENLTTLRGFQSTGVEELTIRNLPKLEVIEHTAFHDSRVRELIMEELPELKRISSYAFQGNRLTGKLDLTKFPKLEEIGSNAFENNKLITADFTDLDALKKIGSNAFSNNLIRNVIIKDLDNLEKIEDNAFFNQDNQRSLTSVEIANNPKLTYLGGFYYNKQLKRVFLDKLPALEEIGSNAFNNTAIPRLDLRQFMNLKKIHSSAYYESKIDGPVLLPESLVEIGNAAFQNNKVDTLDLSHLTKLQRIGSGAYIKNNTIMDPFKVPETADYIEWNHEMAAVKLSDLDFTGQNIKVKLKSAKPFKTTGPLVMHFDRASQLEIPASIENLDPNNPTVLFIKNMDKELTVPKGILINPATVNVRYEDENGKALYEGLAYSNYFPRGAEVVPPTLEGYAISTIKPNPENLATFDQTTKTATINEVQQNDGNVLTFVYSEVPPIDANDYKINIYRKENKHERSYVDWKLDVDVEFTFKRVPGDEQNTKFVVQLPEYATDNPSEVEFPKDIKSVELTQPPIYNPKTKQVVYFIKRFNEDSPKGTIRVNFKMKVLDTPHEQKHKVKAYYVLQDGRRKGPLAESEEFTTWRYEPTFSKSTTEGENTTLNSLPADGSNDKYTNVTMSFDFSFDSTRRINELLIEDKIPTYLKWDEATGGPITAYPEFDPAKNPGWEYDEATHTARYIAKREYLDQFVENYGRNYIHTYYIRRALPKLVLDFPKAVRQKNIENRATGTLKIDQPKANDKPEYIREVKENRGIDFGTDDSGIEFWKNGQKNNKNEFLLPQSSDSLTDHPWKIVFKPSQIRSFNKEQVKYYRPIIDNIEIWEYDLGGNHGNIQLKDRTFDYTYIRSDQATRVSFYKKDYNYHNIGQDSVERPIPAEEDLIKTISLEADETYRLTEEESKTVLSMKFEFPGLVFKELNEAININIGSRVKPGYVVPNISRDLQNASKVFYRLNVPELQIENRLGAKRSESSKYIRPAYKQIEASLTSSVPKNSTLVKEPKDIIYTTGYRAEYTESYLNDLAGEYFIDDFKMVTILPGDLVIDDIELNPLFLEYGGKVETKLIDGKTHVIYTAPKAPSKLPWIGKVHSHLKVGIPGRTSVNASAYIDIDQMGVSEDNRIRYKNASNVAEAGNRSLPNAQTGFNVLLNDILGIEKYIRNATRNGGWQTSVRSLPEDTIEYKFEVANNFSDDLREVAFFDLFPNFSDRKLTPNEIGNYSLRNSEFKEQFLEVKSIKLRDIKNNISRTVNLDDFPVTYIKNTTGYPTSSRQGQTKDWVDKALTSPDFTTINKDEAIGIYIGGEATSVIPGGHVLEIVLEMKNPKKELKDVEEWEGQKNHNTVAFIYEGTSHYIESAMVTNILEAPKKTVIFKKVDQETNEPLKGARFLLTQKNDKDKSKEKRYGITTPDGLVYFRDVYYKDYTLTEETAPEGYRLDTTIRSYSLTEDNYKEDKEKLDKGESIETLEAIINNEKLPPEDNKRFTITLHKKNQTRNVPNVKFVLENIGMKEQFSALTNAEGKITFEKLKRGQYRLVEESNLNNFTPIRPILFDLPFAEGFTHESITSLTSKTTLFKVDNKDVEHTFYTLEIPNETYQVTLVKRGVSELERNILDTNRSTSVGKALPNVSFQLYATSKRVINGQVEDNTPSEDELKTDQPTANQQSEITTDEKGEVPLANLHANVVYKLVETTELEDFEKMDPIEFYVDEFGSLHQVKKSKDQSHYELAAYRQKNKLVAINYQKTYKRSLRITKVDADTGEVLPGAIFGLKKWNETENSFVTLKNQDGQEITQTTDDKGLAQFDELEYGRYQIVELKAPDGYIKSNNPDELRIVLAPFASKPNLILKTISNRKLTLILAKVEKISGPFATNELALQDLERLKAEREDDEDLIVEHKTVYKRLKGAEFKLTSTHNQEDVIPLSTTDPVDATDGYSVYTYSKGIEEDKSYTLEEVKAPAGYKKIRKLNLKINDLGIRYNHPTVTKFIENVPQKGRIQIMKFDGRTKRVLSGAKFGIYKGHITKDQQQTAEKVAEGETGRDGIFATANLELGEYTIIEEEAPEGFKVLEKVTPVTLTSDQAVARMTFYNNLETTTLRLKKVDDTGQPVRTLEGAAFELYYDKQTTPTTGTPSKTDPGIVEFPNIPIVGDYRIKETKAPNGYVLGEVTEIQFNHTLKNPLQIDSSKNEPKVLMNKKQVQINASKNWDGGKESDRPTVFLKLFRKVEGGKEEEVPGAELKEIGKQNGEVQFGHFDQYKHVGKKVLPFEYLVKEVDKDGTEINLNLYHYTTTQELNDETSELKVVVTNTYESPKTKVIVHKKWENGTTVIKPDLKFTLYRKIEGGLLEVVPNQEITVPKTDGKVEFIDLDQTDHNGNVYTYEVHEVKKDGNAIDNQILFTPQKESVEAEMNGQDLEANFTNEYVKPKKTVVAIQEWIGGPPTKPDTWFKLFRQVSGGGLEEVEHSQTKVDPVTRQVSWPNMPTTDDQGNIYTYSVTQVDANGTSYIPENYTTSEDGLLVVNTYHSPLTKRIVSKHWNVVAGEKLPASVEITLTGKVENPVPGTIAGETVEKVLTLSEKVNWHGEFTDLPVTDMHGNPYTYTVQETPLVGFSSTQGTAPENTFSITNTQEKTQRRVENIVRNIPGEEDPETITVDLLRNGKVYKTMVVTKEENYNGLWTELPIYDENGNVYTYSVQATVPGFTTSGPELIKENGEDQPETGYRLTHVREAVSLEVSKIWKDESDHLDRPDELKVHIYRNKIQNVQELPYKTVTLTKGTDNNKWTTIVDQLPKMDLRGRLYQYTIEEEVPAGYESVINDLSITNTRQLVKIPVEKTWKLVSGEREYPEAIQYILKRDGKEIATQIIERPTLPNEPGAWNYTFEEDAKGNKLPRINPLRLPSLDNPNREYHYTVEEKILHKVENIYQEIKGFEPQIKEYHVTNTQEEHELTISVVWIGGPKPTTKGRLVRRKKGSNEGTSETVREFETNTDTKITYKVPKYSPEGLEYEYSVEEDDIPDYDIKIEGLNIVNTYIPPRKNVVGKKVWEGGPESNRPKIWFKLIRRVEGKEWETVEKIQEINPQTNEAVWENVEQTNSEGKSYEFKVLEVDENGDEKFVPHSYEKKEEGLVVTNTYRPPFVPYPPEEETPEAPSEETPDEPSEEIIPTDPNVEIHSMESSSQSSNSSTSEELEKEPRILPRTGTKNYGMIWMHIVLHIMWLSLGWEWIRKGFK